MLWVESIPVSTCWTAEAEGLGRRTMDWPLGKVMRVVSVTISACWLLGCALSMAATSSKNVGLRRSSESKK